ncbi:MAG: hypothetical protein DWH81_08925 [Planctomycetota bacterium]|nr:MAG: hypothetical protein DWH81_08925 [Planctomycetota bacterium]
MASSSESFFFRALEEKTEKARAAVQRCVSVFLSTNNSSRVEAATQAASAVSLIVDMLSAQDRPYWLSPLHNNLRTAAADPEGRDGLNGIQEIANTFQGALNSHKWKLTEANPADGFDFDSMYNKYKKENRIPELFEEIISLLNEIANSGQLDSISALTELRRVIATLEKAKNGSYFATRNAWHFVTNWFKNSGWEMLSDIPLLGAVTRGLRKTLEDMDHGMTDLHTQIQDELQTKIAKDFPRIEYTSPDLPRIEHSPQTQVEQSN